MRRIFADVLKQNLIFIFLLIILQIILIRPFFHSGFFPTHDGIQTIRVFEYFQALKFGVFPPRWASGLLYGYGYPLFIFYNPLVYFLGSIIALTGITFLTTTKLVFIIAFIFGSLGMFFAINEMIESFPAFVGAFIYSLAPYRAVDVYVRGDLAEFFALSLFPIVLYFNLRLLKNKKNKLYFILFTLSIVLLVLAHNISVFIFAGFLLIFNIFYIINVTKRKDRMLIVKMLILVIVLVFLLGSFYLIPLLYEIRFVQIERLQMFSYKDYFLNLKQIWDSPWGYGGFLQSSPMSLMLGKVIIISSVAVTIMNYVIRTDKRNLILFFLIMLFWGTFLETKSSGILWSNIKVLSYFQFPWRIHILTTFYGAILVGYFVYLLNYVDWIKKRKFIFYTSGIIIILAGCLESINFFREKSFIEEKVSSETTTGEEYLPKWVLEKPSEYPPDKVISINGNNTINNISWGYSVKSFDVDSQNGGRIEIEHIYFPGWSAYTDNKKTQIYVDNPNGSMQIDIPGGVHNIIFKFEETWWRKLGDYLSLFGLVIIIYILYSDVKNKFQK